MILAGDIGGTKTVLALCKPDGERWQTVREQRFACSGFASLEAVIAAFLEGAPERPAVAAFGVAGPVFDGRAKVTNLPWQIDEAAIAERFGIPVVRLINDLAAVATAVPHLEPADLETIQPGHTDRHGVKAVIAPGTGLGQAFLVWSPAGWRVCPTEGGHATFAAATEEQFALSRFVAERYGHASVERVCSGSGLQNLYDFLRASGRYPEPDWLCERLAAEDDRTPLILEAALNGQAAICVATLDLFLDILAREIGNTALKLFASGGIYLGGGLPPRMLERLRRSHFVLAIRNKGRFRDWVAGLPIHVILEPQAALHGAIWTGLAALREEQS